TLSSLHRPCRYWSLRGSCIFCEATHGDHEKYCPDQPEAGICVPDCRSGGGVAFAADLVFRVALYRSSPRLGTAECAIFDCCRKFLRGSKPCRALIQGPSRKPPYLH